MTSSNDNSGRFPWTGIILIVLGGFFLVDTLDLLDLGDFFADWWPLILVLIGLVKFQGDDRSGAWFFLVIGVILLLTTLDVLSWNLISQFWPLVLIFIGIMLLVRNRRSPIPANLEETDDTVRVRAIFGGAEQTAYTSNFRGGIAEAIFGGVELDLRDAKLSQEGASMNLTALFGGVELRVPSEWNVQVSGTPIFGGIENKTGSKAEPGGPVLHCNCYIGFGGIEIRE